MKRKIKFSSIILAIFCILVIPVSAETTDELLTPKKMFYRMGTTDTPETRENNTQNIDLTTEVINTKPVSIKEDKKDRLTYADLSIKSISNEVSKSIEIDYDDMLGDLSLLWQGAATKSDTIKFAIYKLSNPDKDKPDDSAVKKVLTTIAGMSTFLGAGTGNPILAGSALIGGNTLGILSQDPKALNYQYTRVTDADMIILIRKVDELQQKIVNLYYDYMTSRELYNLTNSMVKSREKIYKASQNEQKEILLITDTFYREALNEQMKATGQFFEKRSQLEQLVGSEIFNQFEQNLDERKQ